MSFRKSDVHDEAPLPGLVDQWLDEINAGETRLRELTRRPAPPIAVRADRGEGKTKTRSKVKPFQRNQISDPVGTARRSEATAAA